MNTLDKIIHNHTTKSNQLKKAHRKLKNKTRNTLDVHELETLLRIEQREKINAQDYMSWGSFEGGAFERDVATKEARVDLLQDLIRRIKENRK